MRAVGVVICAGCYAPATLQTDPDLVGYWAFAPGTTVVDLTGNAPPVSLGPGATFAAGAPGLGTGVSFDGECDGFIDVGTNPAIADLGPMTVAAWIQPNQNTIDNIKTIVTKGPANGSVGRWVFNIDGNGGDNAGIAFTRFTSGQQLVRGTPKGSLVPDVWQHVAVTWDGNLAKTDVHLYLDGGEITSMMNSIDGTGTFEPDAANPLTLGNEVDHSRGFGGSLDDVRIYKRVLTAAEISDLAHP